jgi:ABC-2 type transport system permease protein
VILAILWAQWKSSRLVRFGGGKRGAVFSWVTSFLWYACWAVAAIALGAFTADPKAKDDIRSLFPAALVFVILYWQVAPVLVASLGAALDLKKLLVYPIPPENLFWVEVALRVSTGVETLLLLFGAGAGLMLNPEFGGWTKVPRVVAPLLVFVLFNLLLAAGLRSLIERLLGRKRVREVFVVLLVMVAALPQLLIVTGGPKTRVLRMFTENASVVWPWMCTSRLALDGAAAVPWAALLAWTAAAYLFGRWQFQSNLRFDFRAAEATDLSVAHKEDSWRESLFRLPSALFPDPVAAIVEKELRTLSRAPRFRLVFIMGFTFGLVVWLPLIFGRVHDYRSPAVQHFLTLVCLYSLAMLGQVTYWNAFGFDRSATQGYFVWPVPVSRVLIGKNLAAGVFVFLEMLAVTSVCLLFRMAPQPDKILEAFLVTPVVAVYLLTAGNLSSIYMPRALNAERVAQGGAAGRSQAFMLFVYPVAVLPALLAFGARYAFHSELAFYLMLAFDAGLGAMVYWIALDSAVKAAEQRKEEIISVLSSNDGPVMME